MDSPTSADHFPLSLRPTLRLKPDEDDLNILVGRVALELDGFRRLSEATLSAGRPDVPVNEFHDNIDSDAKDGKGTKKYIEAKGVEMIRQLSYVATPNPYCATFLIRHADLLSTKPGCFLTSSHCLSPSICPSRENCPFLRI